MAGLAVSSSLAGSPLASPEARRTLLIALVAATAPDLDLAVRLIDGRNHHGTQAHSLGAAVLAATAVLLLAWWRRWPGPARLAAAAGLAWGGHVLLDWLGMDTHPPIGIMALWPLSHEHFTSPLWVFRDVGRNLDLHTVRHNLLSLAWEMLVLVPLALVAWKRRRGGPEATPRPPDTPPV